MDRIIVVTGAASGMGLATSNLLKERGDKVISVDVKGDVDIYADLSVKEGREESVKKIHEVAPGYVDGIITWAGMGNGRFIQTLAVNFFGQVALIEGVHDLLMKSRAPRVVVTSSRSSLFEPNCPQIIRLCLAGKEEEAIELGNSIIKNCKEGNDERQMYISSKAASTLWMRRMAIRPEWGGSNILMNGIAPGLIETPMTKPTLTPDSPYFQWVTSEHPQAVNAPDHLIQAEEMAQLACFLLSEEQKLLIGQMIYADYGTECIVRGEIL